MKNYYSIVIEGIDCSGKTTLLRNLKKEIIRHFEFAKLIEAREFANSPLNTTILEMAKHDNFLRLNKDFKTSIYETLILTANYIYSRNNLYQNINCTKNNFIIFDRDFYTILAYQQEIIKKEYPDKYLNIYKSIMEILKLDIVKPDLIIYLDIPVDIAIKRLKERDGYIINNEEKQLLKSFKNNYTKILPLEKLLTLKFESSNEDKINTITNRILSTCQFKIGK